MNNVKELPLSRLIKSVKACVDGRQKYCFILGAGASVSSGIKSGVAMATEWMADLKADDLKRTTEWMERENINEDDIGSHYSAIYEERFSVSKHEGYIWLQNAMKEASPGLGYYHLANLLADDSGCINRVITTNFDSLTEDAIFMYTDKKPLVATHESLADYISDSQDRPVVAKIHRDLMLRPFSSEKDTKYIQEQWSKALISVLSTVTPIVIGYGGNDGSLMQLLDDVATTNAKNGNDIQIFWCYRIADGIPKNEKIIKLLEKCDGSLVPIEDFDMAMFQFGLTFGHEFNKDEEKLRKQLDTRISNYKEHRNKIMKHLEEEKEGKALSKDAEAVLTALTESQQKELEMLNAQITKNPEDANLYNRCGDFYHNIDDYQRAIDDLSDAIGIDPDNAYFYRNRGVNYSWINEHEKALTDLSMAIERNSSIAYFYKERGVCYIKINDYEKAIADLSKAVALAPREVESYAYLSRALRWKGDFANALINIEKGFRLDKNFAPLYAYRGMINLRIAKQTGAKCGTDVLEDFNKAVDLEKTKSFAPLVYTSRACYHLYAKDGESAYKDLQAALEVNNKNGRTWYTLSQYYKVKGDTEEENRCIEKSKECNYIPNEEDDVFI